MAYVSYYKLWESEVGNIISKRNKLPDLNINQLKLELHDNYGKDEKKQQSLNLLIMQMLKKKLI